MMSVSTTPRIANAGAPLDPRLVGGKLARQKTLADHGLAVPRFFCLTTAFYAEAFAPLEHHVRLLLAKTDFGRAESIRSAADEIRTLFATLALSRSGEEEILAEFDRTFPPGTLVAVRASTVGHKDGEGEDSADNPFAGMSESFLYVARGEVAEKVRLAWASGFSAESLTYRHAQGMDPLGFGVGVAVQEMVLGERSFVLFTCDPKRASRDTVVVAGYGIGEGVVQEKVAVDHYFVSGATREVRAEIAEKPEKLTLDEQRGKGLVMRPTAPELRGAPCLSDDEVKRLADLGKRVEAIFGAPQDVEGTITRDGRVHLLQARPIAFDYRKLRVWTNANVTESFPGVTTALTYSFSRFFYRTIFRDCYRRLGIGAEALHDDHETLDRMIGFLEGRVYYCLSSFYLLHSRSPLFPLFRAHWEKMMGFPTSYQTQPRTLLSVSRFGAHLAIAASRFATHERAMKRFHAWWEALVAPLRGKSFADEDPLVTIGEFHRVWREVGREWGVTLLNDTYLPMIYGYTEKLFKALRLDADPSLLSDLLLGGDELLSVAIIDSAVRLAERVREDAALREAFATHSAEDVWAALERGELDEAFTRAFREHLHRYGDRGLQELKIEQPNLRDTPEALVRTVQGYARGEVTVDGLRTQERIAREWGEERLRRALRFRPAERALVRGMLALLRRLIRARENSRYARSELFGFSKNVFRGLGAQMVRRGALRDVADVFHLTQDEVFGWFDGTGTIGDVQALADLRKREKAAHEASEPAMEITTVGAVRDHALSAPAAAPSETGALRGLGSSPGKVRGRARVVVDPTKVDDLGPAAILVARETDPGWLFLMLAAKGMVVERGSMLSHTAITGRKFSIPTIVSLPAATTRIPDGAWIEIDGASGVVTILDEAAP